MTTSHKTTLALSAIAAMVVMVVAVTPLATNVEAKKTVQEEECVGDPQERERCPGQSGGNNPNREQQECQVTGGGGQIVQGQQKKVC